MNLRSRQILLVALMATACTGAVHRVSVEPSGGYATELVPTAVDAVSRGVRTSLPSDVVCDVSVRLDAAESGRAGAGIDAPAGSMMAIDVAIRAVCDENPWSSRASLTVLTGPRAEAGRAALDSATERVCLSAARRLEPED